MIRERDPGVKIGAEYKPPGMSKGNLRSREGTEEKIVSRRPGERLGKGRLGGKGRNWGAEGNDGKKGKRSRRETVRSERRRTADAWGQKRDGQPAGKERKER